MAAGRKRKKGIYDLDAILREVAKKYLGREVNDVTISWSRVTKPKNKYRKWMYYGKYYPETKQITIHPTLNNIWVPDYFVGYVVYHELLHHVMIPHLPKHAIRSGKVEWHPELFLLAERLYYKYDDAIRWEETNLNRLLSS